MRVEDEERECAMQNATTFMASRFAQPTQLTIGVIDQNERLRIERNDSVLIDDLVAYLLVQGPPALRRFMLQRFTHVGAGVWSAHRPYTRAALVRFQQESSD
jgi:hypothetical protein